MTSIEDIELAFKLLKSNLFRRADELSTSGRVVGGNKHREGFIYKLTNLSDHKDVQNRIEKNLQETIEKIKSSQPVGKTPLANA